MAARVIKNADSDFEDEKDITEADFIKCPVSDQKVDPNIIIPNVAIKYLTETYLDENPWAYDFNPREKLENIKVWD